MEQYGRYRTCSCTEPAAVLSWTSSYNHLLERCSARPVSSPACILLTAGTCSDGSI